MIWTQWIKNEWDVLPVLFQLAKIFAIFISKTKIVISFRKWEHGIF